MPAPAVLAAPTPSATGVAAGSPLEFAAATGSVHHIKLTSTGAQPYSLKITTATSTKLPSIPEAPMPRGFGPALSSDDAATADGMESVSENDFVGPRHFASSSAARTFTSM